MTNHYIILGESYSRRTRIGLYFQNKSGKQLLEEVKTIKEYIEKFIKYISYSCHYMKNDLKNFDEIKEYDYFFEGIEIVDTKEEFVKILLEDNKILAVDIKRYIERQVNYSDPEKLNILLYLCYAEYLCNNRKKLYIDLESTINPKKEKVLMIKEPSLVTYNTLNEEKNYKLLLTDAFSIEFSSVKETIQKYSKLPTEQLKEIIHGPNTPITKAQELQIELNDELILNNHCYETNNGKYF